MTPDKLQTFSRGDLAARGQWERASSGGLLTALVSCPDCGRLMSLSRHDINVHGFVTPSLVCECGFHAYIKLDDWKG